MSAEWKVILVAVVVLFVANVVWAVVSEIMAQNKMVKFWDEKE